MPVLELSASNTVAKEAKFQMGQIVEYRKSKWTDKQVTALKNKLETRNRLLRQSTSLAAPKINLYLNSMDVCSKVWKP